MIIKVCFRCNIQQPLTDYYVHKQMGDGHLNKCKTCTKQDSKKREKKLRKSTEWVEQEKIRAREKYNRLGYKDLHKPTKEERRESMKRYKEKFPEKQQANNNSQYIKVKTGNHKHHWSYNEIHYKDIIELKELEHSKLHRYLIYDQERMMYRTLDGILLDTKEAHIGYFNTLKDLP